MPHENFLWFVILLTDSSACQSDIQNCIVCRKASHESGRESHERHFDTGHYYPCLVRPAKIHPAQVRHQHLTVRELPCRGSTREKTNWYPHFGNRETRNSNWRGRLTIRKILAVAIDKRGSIAAPFLFWCPSPCTSANTRLGKSLCLWDCVAILNHKTT